MVIRTFKSHNESGAKITATSRPFQNDSGKLRKCIVTYDYAYNAADNHELAAAKLATIHGSSWVERTGSHLRGYCYMTTD